jgi:hypothetical protein
LLQILPTPKQTPRRGGEEGVNEARERLRGSTELFRAGRSGGGAGAEARQERDGVVMCWGAREGVVIWWGWRVDARKCEEGIEEGRTEDEASTHLDGTEAEYAHEKNT